MPESTDTRTYEVVTSDGTFRIDVPANAKITFGPVVGASGKPSFGESGNSLRIWEGEKIQRALFLGVRSFRDLSMPMTIRAVREFGKEEWWADDGSWTGSRAELVERSWRSPDDLVEMPPDRAALGTVVDEGPRHLMKPRRDRAFAVEAD